MTLRKLGCSYPLIAVAVAGLATPIALPATGQIAPDGTLGQARSRVSPNRKVRGQPAVLIQGGARRGPHLFQSFSEFNVNAGQRVYFANPSGITNILTRVTGRTRSNILGTLGVAGSANLFLLNPNGILFGANARLDIAGSFFASTADSLDLGNGFQYSATRPESPVLNVSLRPGLQLGQPSIGDIRNEGKLTVGSGQTLILHGNRVTHTGTLKAPDNGTVKLLSDRLVTIDQAQIDISDTASGSNSGGNITVDSKGEVTIRNSSLDAKSDSASRKSFTNLFVRGASVTLDRAYISTTNLGSGLAGDVAITARDRVDILNSQNTALSLGIFSRGNGGRIFIGASPYFSESPAIVHLDNSQLSTDNRGLAASQGNVGRIAIRATSEISMVNGSTISSTTFQKGKAGSVRLDSAGNISLRGSSIFSNTFQDGDAGLVTLQAAGRVSLRQGAALQSGASETAQGNAGGVQIIADSLDMREKSEIVTSTYSTKSTASTIASIPTSAAGSLAGAVYLLVKNDIQLNDSNIFNNLENGAKGTAGVILILAESLSLQRGAQVQTLVRGQNQNKPAAEGTAGNILIGVEKAVKVSGRNRAGFASAIFSSVGQNSPGTAGNVYIQAETVHVRDRGTINVDNAGSGAAGNVFVFAKGVWLDQASTIFARSLSGRGGNVNLNVPGALILGRTGIISTSTDRGETGTFQRGAGNITIGTGTTLNDPTFLVAAKTPNNNDIFAIGLRSAGGKIQLKTLRLQDIAERQPALDTNDISAKSGVNQDGTTVVKTTDIDPARGVTALASDYEEPRLEQGCDPRERAETSRFVITGSGGIPSNPNAEPLSPTAATWEESPRSPVPRQASQPDNPMPPAREIIVAQGFSVAPDGEILLAGAPATVQPQAPWSRSPRCHAH